MENLENSHLQYNTENSNDHYQLADTQSDHPADEQPSPNFNFDCTAPEDDFIIDVDSEDEYTKPDDDNPSHE